MKHRHGIVGGGFTGLSFAYYLVKAGTDPRSIIVWDSGESLVGTHRFDWGLSESAANGVFASLEFPEICRDIGVDLLKPKRVSQRRYIFRNGRLRRWPVSFQEVFSMAACFLRQGFRWKPKPCESLANWGRRLGGPEFVEHLLQPGIQGIFGSSADRLSARLVMAALRTRPNRQKGKRQTLAPVKGMGDYLRALRVFLEERGVVFVQDRVSRPQISSFSGCVTLAIDPLGAVELLDPSDTRRPWLLKHQRVGLVSQTLCLQEDSRIPRGFGALFPWPGEQALTPLGVLFNSDIFSDRVFQPGLRSETWIYPYVESKVPDLDQVLMDRKKFLSLPSDCHKVVGHQTSVWPRALPLYSVEWEMCLEEIRSYQGPGAHLLGPSYGGLGLASVLGDCRELAESVVRGTKEFV